jgi:hypothetical protein
MLTVSPVTKTLMLHEGMSFLSRDRTWPVPEGSLETFSTNDVMKDCLLLKKSSGHHQRGKPSWDSKRTSDMLCEAFLAQIKHGTKRYVRDHRNYTVHDKDLILTVFGHVPTKYVFAVVTSRNWNVRISTSPTLEDWVDDTLYLGKSSSLHKDRSGFRPHTLRAQPGVDKYDDDDRFAVSELMNHLHQIDHTGVDEVSFYAEVSTVGNTIDSHGGSRVRREKLWNNVHTHDRINRIVDDYWCVASIESACSQTPTCIRSLKPEILARPMSNNFADTFRSMNLGVCDPAGVHDKGCKRENIPDDLQRCQIHKQCSPDYRFYLS